MKRLVTIIFIFFIFSNLFNKNIDIVFMNPGSENDIFFKIMTNFMIAVSSDLDIELEIIYCNRNHIILKQETLKVLDREHLPDYIFLINEKNAISSLIPIADKKGVKIFLFNEGIILEERQNYGYPETIYKNWIKEYLPDDFQAGYLLAKELIKDAKQKNLYDEDGYINVVGISGSYMTNSSSLRVQGLKKAIEEDKETKLLQIAPAHWKTDHAGYIAEGFIKRYPKVNVYWCASDGMALGVTNKIIELNIKPGKDIITGGIDWAEFALDKVKTGDFTCSIGGHYMDGGWGLIMLYDYHNGIPFEKGLDKSKFFVLKSENIHDYSDIFMKADWGQIDFTQFSKHKNKTISKYNFDIEQLIEYLK